MQFDGYSKEDLNKTGVYTITSKVNGKIYVGSTAKGFEKRWVQHYWALRTEKHFNIHLQRHVNIHGIESLKFEILEECLPQFVLSSERFWINQLNSVNDGFNKCYPESLKIGKNHPRYITFNQEDKELIINFFCKENKTIREISDIFGYKDTLPIKRVLKEFKVERNSNIRYNKTFFVNQNKKFLKSKLRLKTFARINNIGYARLKSGFRKYELPPYDKKICDKVITNNSIITVETPKLRAIDRLKMWEKKYLKPQNGTNYEIKTLSL